ncbi:MAG: hypothetical protein JSV90_00305 [Methanobacteriota archaeon]|nr:MAG: hypothetical protein JSV90_00305 [Euryarchaeota archaeon]
MDVDSSEAVAVIKLAAAIAILGYASISDLRTRRASNWFWIALSAIGVAMIPVTVAVEDMSMSYLLILIPILAVLSDVFWDAESSSALARSAPFIKYGLAIVATAALGVAWGDEGDFQSLLIVPIVMLLIILLYMLDVIRGGADAKALISISIVFPSYPVVASMPLITSESEVLQTVVPFTFSVLVNAALLVVFLPLAFLLINLIRRDLLFPQMFLGYRTDGRDALRRHVWLMERIVDGKRVLYSRPKTEEDLRREIDLLKDHGHLRIWVTPKIPFIVPIFISLILTALIGNPFFLLFGF